MLMPVLSPVAWGFPVPATIDASEDDISAFEWIDVARPAQCVSDKANAYYPGMSVFVPGRLRQIDYDGCRRTCIPGMFLPTYSAAP